MEIKDKIRFYADIFQEAHKLTYNQDAAIMITQEIGKDLRQSMIPDNKMPQFTPKPNIELASPKQIAAMKKYNIKFNEGITRDEANAKIKASIESI